MRHLLGVDYNTRDSGTENVRLVDMSIAPLHIAAHLLDTAYAIGEKASGYLSVAPRGHLLLGLGSCLDQSRARVDWLLPQHHLMSAVFLKLRHILECNIVKDDDGLNRTGQLRSS